MDHSTLGNANRNGKSHNSDDDMAFEDLSSATRTSAQQPMDIDMDLDLDNLGGDNDDDDDEAALFGKESDEDEDDADLSHFAGTDDPDADQDALAADPDSDPMDVDQPSESPERQTLDQDLMDPQLTYDDAGFQQSQQEDASARAYDELPTTVLKLGDNARFMPEDTVYQLDLPRTLRVDPLAFDPDQYEPLDPDTTPDHTMLIHTESTVRWRPSMDPSTGGPVMQSNAHLIQWSDGSLGLMLGDEIYPVSTTKIPPHHHIVHIQAADNALVSEVPLREKMHVKMASGAAGTKRFRATLQSSQAAGRRAGTRMIEADRDFEKEHEARIRAEKENAKANKKLEAQKRRMARKYEDQEGIESGGAARGSSRRSRSGRRGARSADLVYSDEEEDAASDAYDDDEDEYASDSASGGRRRSSRRSGGAAGGAGGDDLDGFVVDDDDAIVNYDDDDEAEEQAELMVESRRRSAADNRASRAEALARQRGQASQSAAAASTGGDQDDQEDDAYTQSRASAAAGAGRRRAVLDDD